MSKTSSRTSRAVAGTITSLMQYAFIMLLQFILAPVVLRIAGKEVLGAYSFLMQIISWAALTDLGFGVAIGRNLAQAVGLDDQRQLFRKIFITGRTFYVVSNLACAGLILILSWKLDSFMHMSTNVGVEARWSLIILSIWVAIRTPLALYNDALVATQNLAAANIIMAVGAAVRLLLSLVLVLSGANLIGMILANIIAEAVTYLLGYLWYHKIYTTDKFGWGIPDRSLFHQMLKFGLSYMIVIVAGRLSANTDSIIVGYIFGASAVSVYYVSQMPGTILYQLFWKITDNSAPALNELHGRNAVSQLTGAYLRLMRYSLLLVIPLSIGLIGFNRWVITLWVGAAQYSGDVLTIALALFAITQVVNHLNYIVLVAYGDVRIMSILSFSGGIVKVIMAFWLGHIMGLQGVMVANAFVDIIGFIYFSNRVWRTLGLSFGEVSRITLFPALKSNILPVIVMIVMLIKPPTVTWLLLFIWVSVFGISWALGTARVGLLTEERNQINVYVKRRLNLNLRK